MKEPIRVLVVDDESSSSDRTATRLEREDSRITVETEQSVGDGLRRLSEAEFDCIVSSYNLPDRSGLKFLEAVREIDSRLPFILFTAEDTPDIGPEDMFAEMTEYIQKGGKHEQYTILVNRVLNVVERTRTQRDHQPQVNAIETAREGISIVNQDGQFLYVNETYAELYGCEQEELTGEHWEILYRDEDVRKLREEILPTVEETGYWYGTTYGLRADGSTFMKDQTIASTADGKLVCTIQDISNQMERARQFEAVFNNTFTFVGMMEPDGTLIEANETALSFGGLSREDVVGKPIWETYWFQANGDARRAARDAVEQARDGGIYRKELRVQGADSEAVIDFSVRSVTDEDGNVELLVPEGREITARKQHTRRLETLIDNVPGIVYRCENERGWPMESVRGEVEELTGYTPTELEARDEIFGDQIIHPDDRENVRETIQEALDSREPFEVTYRINTKDDATKWVWERGQKIDVPENDLDVLEGFITDITSQKKVTEALQKEREFITQALDMLDDIFYVVGTDGELRRWNYRLSKVTGYADEEIAEMQAIEFFPESEQERIIDAIEETLTSGEVIVESTLLTADGDRSPYEFTGTRLTDSAGDVIGLVGTGRDMTEHKRRERELQRERDRFEQLVDEVSEYAIFMIDTDGHIVTWNIGARRIKGYTEDEAVGEHHSMLYPDDAVAREKPDKLLSEASRTGVATDEGWRVRKDGTQFWADVTITALYDESGDLRGFTKVTHDVTERKQYENRIAGLNDVLASVMAAKDKETVCDITIDAAQTTLDLSVTLVALFDDDRGALDKVAQTPAVDRKLDVEQLLQQEGPAWDAFTSDEQIVLGQDEPLPERAVSDDSIDSLVVVPLGRHGVVIAAPRPVGTTELEIEFIETIGENLRNALNGVERESLLVEGEERLAERTEQLEQLNRINEIIRTIDRELVAATSRTEIEQTVCQELADSGPYQFAGIGEYENKQDSVRCRAQAGDDSGYLGNVSRTIQENPADQEPTIQALQTEQSQVIKNIRTDPPYEPWQEDALKRGYCAAVAVPITYRDRLYSVLTLYADTAELVHELEQEVLDELGKNIGHAINAIETRRTLVSDTVVELEVGIPTSKVPFLQSVCRESEYSFTIETLAPEENATYRVLITVPDTPSTDLIDDMRQSPHVRAVDPVTSADISNRYRCLVDDESFITWLLDHGGIPRSITVDDQNGRLTVHLSRQANVRKFVELLQSRYDDAELLARRELEHAEKKRQTFKTELDEKLTARQQETLRLAYAGGYFESPREQTASGLAETLDITQPTFSEHLRASQRKLLGLLYDDEKNLDG